MKKALQKSTLFHLYEILENVNQSIKAERRFSGDSEGRAEEGISQRARESFQTDWYIYYLTVLTIAKVHMRIRLKDSHTLYAWVLFHVNKKIKLQKKYLI